MRKLVTIAVCFAAVTAVAGTSLQFGRPMAVADLRSGDPATFGQVYAVWQDGGDVAAVVQRATSEHSDLVRMTIGADGHADPAAIVTLPMPLADSQTFIAPMGESIMAVWWNHDNTSTAVRFDRNGVPLTTKTKVAIVPWGLRCNAQRCLEWESDRGVLLDSDAHSVAAVNQPIAKAVAGDSGFLIWDSKNFTLLDNDGNARLSIPSTLFDANLSFDGRRYVIAGTPPLWSSATIKLWTIDPVSDAATQQPALTMQPAGYNDYTVGSCTVTWNGSQHLLLETMFPQTLPQPAPSPLPAFLTATRLSPAFAPIDAAAQPLTANPNVSLPAVAPRSDGFSLVFGASHGSARTAFIRSSDGGVTPDANGQTIVVDRASQLPLAVAASRSAILGVYLEPDGAMQKLEASRVDRSGKHLDAAPIDLGSSTGYGAVAAASDGDGYLVVWQDSSTRLVTGAFIDASGHVGRSLPQWNVYASIRKLNLDYINGGYRLAFFGNDEIFAFTLTVDGTGGEGRSYLVYQNTAGARDIRFDGTRIVAVWSTSTGTYSLIQEARDNFSIRTIAPPSGESVNDLVMAPDGDGYVVATSTVNQANATRTSLFLNRLSHDGQFVLPAYGVLAATQITPTAHSLLRIDGGWFATTIFQTSGFEQPLQYVRELTPFNAATLQAGPLSILTDSVYRQLASGWNGEALAWSGTDVPIASGWARQMNVQLVHTSRPRAAGK